jgi:hypothetical protein
LIKVKVGKLKLGWSEGCGANKLVRKPGSDGPVGCANAQETDYNSPRRRKETEVDSNGFLKT